MFSLFSRRLGALFAKRKYQIVFTIFLLFLSFILLVLVNKILYKGSFKLSNTSRLVPNIVHYVIFDFKSIDFITYLSVLSVLKVQRPKEILIHCDCKTISGNYWSQLLEISHNVSVPIKLVYLERPTHVFGQKLSSVFHASDVARIKVLMKHGGIYIDTDILILRPLDLFLNFEMVIGWPKNEDIGTQILIANKSAKFLKLWLNGYQRYVPRAWYFNAGQYPAEQILKNNPALVHRVPVLFGVHNLLDKLYRNSNWIEWREYYSIHLLSRHPPAPKRYDEYSIKRNKTPFGEIARWLLFELLPITVPREDYFSSTFPPDYVQ